MKNLLIIVIERLRGVWAGMRFRWAVWKLQRSTKHLTEVIGRRLTPALEEAITELQKDDAFPQGSVEAMALREVAGEEKECQN